MLTDKASIKKGIRFWSVGILGGLLFMLGASLYFIDQEKKAAEARLYETAEYVKVQSSSVTHYMKHWSPSRFCGSSKACVR